MNTTEALWTLAGISLAGILALGIIIWFVLVAIERIRDRLWPSMKGKPVGEEFRRTMSMGEYQEHGSSFTTPGGTDIKRKL